MASLTIRNLDDSLKADLRLRAARHGCSMEEEARQILRQTLARGTPAGSLARCIHERFAGLDAESLPIPARQPSRPAPQLD
ncbi:MAG: plasmid stabilization protein [Dokdonella sp.]|nr:plasmid stabilization protein [Chromatiaceae bacterium]